MAKTIVSLLDTDEVENILSFYLEEDEDKEAKAKLLMGRVEDGTLNHYVMDTFGGWIWENYWDEVENAVMRWADYVLNDGKE